MSVQEAIKTSGGAAAKARVNGWFAGAAILSLLTTGVHVFAGGRGVMNPLYGSNAPISTVAVMDVIWQQVTALLLGAAIVSAIAAFRPSWRLPVAVLVGGHFVVVCAVFLIWGALWFASPWPMPQWVVFLIIAVLMFIGWRRGR